MNLTNLFDAAIETENVVYKNIRDLSKYADDKAYAENLWKNFKPLADKEFLAEFSRDFHARYWEMYLANALLDAGHTLGASKKNHGPDLYIKQDEEKIWIEAVIAKKGDGDDAPEAVEAGMKEIAPGFRIGSVKALSDEPLILRYTTAINYKFDKYNKYLAQNIISGNHPFIIALNGGEVPFDFVKDSVPRIVKALFALGQEQCVLNTSTMEVIAASFQYKAAIVKKSGNEVETDIFLNNKHEGISAIIYDCENVCNRIAPLGSGFVVIHNPFAKNPLPRGFLKVGTEYWVEGDELKFSR